MTARCMGILVLMMSLGVVRAADWLHPVPQTAPAPQAAPEITTPTKPSFEQFQQDVQDKNYSRGLQDAARLLADQSVQNRYDVLMLKAQCHLNLKMPDLARDAFSAAAKSTKVSKEMALATANQYVVGHAMQLAYTPKYTRLTPPNLAANVDNPDDTKANKPQKNAPNDSATDPYAIKFAPAGITAKPIDIIEPDSRQTALQALYIDELARVLPGLKAAKNDQGIPAMLDAVSKITTLQQLELAATNADAETSAMLNTLITHAGKVMTTALESQTKLETQIKIQANQMNTGTNIYGGRIRNKRGLSSDDSTALKNMITLCNDIVQACKAFDTAAGGENGVMSKVTTQADELAKRATKTLNARY